MPRTKKQKAHREDVNEIAFRVVQLATDEDAPPESKGKPPEPEKDEAAVAMAKKRAAKLTKKRRSEIARQAAQARWKTK